MQAALSCQSAHPLAQIADCAGLSQFNWPALGIPSGSGMDRHGGKLFTGGSH